SASLGGARPRCWPAAPQRHDPGGQKRGDPSCAMNWWHGGTAALTAVLLATAAASAEERPLALEVIINGRAIGRVGEFIDRDGALFAKPSALHDLGFTLPPNAPDLPANDPIPLSSL